MKGFSRVFCDVKAYVSCQEYVSILISVRIFIRKAKVAPRTLISNPSLTIYSHGRVFCVLIWKNKVFIGGQYKCS